MTDKGADSVHSYFNGASKENSNQKYEMMSSEIKGSNSNGNQGFEYIPTTRGEAKGLITAKDVGGGDTSEFFNTDGADEQFDNTGKEPEQFTYVQPEVIKISMKKV